MAYQSFDKLAQQVQSSQCTGMAVAAAHDFHTLEAVFAAQNQNVILPLLVGDREKILGIAAALGHAVAPECIFDAPDDAAAAAAVALVREGRAGFLMKGRLETATLLRAALSEDAGIRTGRTMSHVAILQIPAYHKLVAVTDGGMIPHPTLEQKKQIAANAIEVFHALGYPRPQVAVLAASETVNQRQPETADAAALAEMALTGQLPACKLAGPISFDLAFSAESAAAKGYSNSLTGNADILVVPEITCGNVLTKSLLYLAGAKMAGCVVGASVPIVLASRGASAEEKHLSILLAAAIAAGSLEKGVLP